MEHVILVDEQDNIMGTMEKIEVHQKGILHRAFSILLFNSQGEILLQKRATTKYHSGGLWTNTCCSHPLPGESMQQATSRKLEQEMGINVPLKFEYKFLYRTNLGENLTEHELDHVYTGVFNGVPIINPEEVEDWKFVDIKSLRTNMFQNPDDYTVWFRIIMERLELDRSAHVNP